MFLSHPTTQVVLQITKPQHHFEMGLCCGFRLGWRAIREEFAPPSSGNHPELLLPASRIVIAAFNFCLHLIGGHPESLLPIIS